MSRPLIPFADVTVFGGLDVEGELYRKCRIAMSGKPANAILYSKLMGEQRWVPVDRLTEATVTEHIEGTITIEGISDELVTIVGVDPAEAIVRWEITPKDCATCG